MKKSKASFRYVSIGFSCCGDDFIQTEASRYDLGRLGCEQSPSLEQANLVFIQGTLNEKLSQELVTIFEKMSEPKYVIALGSCACGGGLYPIEHSSIPPVDVYVTGCPPRPEAIMNGVLSLQEKAQLS